MYTLNNKQTNNLLNKHKYILVNLICNTMLCDNAIQRILSDLQFSYGVHYISVRKSCSGEYRCVTDAHENKFIRSNYEVIDDYGRIVGYLPAELDRIDLSDNEICSLKGIIYNIDKMYYSTQLHCIVAFFIDDIADTYPDKMYSTEQLIGQSVPFLNNVIFLDIQTANSQDDICQIAAIVIENGTIVKVVDELVNPYEPFNNHAHHSNLHGILPQDTINKQNFRKIWDTAFNFDTDNYTIIATNVKNKLQIIADALYVYHKDKDYFRCIDICRTVIQFYGANTDLSVNGLCDRFGIKAKKEYNSLKDATTELNIFCQLFKQCAISLHYQADNFNFFSHHYKRKKIQKSFEEVYPNKKFDLNQILITTSAHELPHDFSGKVVVLTGEFKRYPNGIPISFLWGAKRAGKAVTKETEILIFADNYSRAKMQLAQKFIDKGHDIKIINEELLYEIIDSKLAVEQLKIETAIKTFYEELDEISLYPIVKNSSTVYHFNNFNNMPDIIMSDICEILNSPKNYTIIHIETTGLSLDEDDEILEISAIKYSEHKAITKFTTLIKPKCKSANSATRYNSITEETVKDAPYIDEIRQSLLSFIGNDIIVCYHAKFILKFLLAYGFDDIIHHKIYDALDYIKKYRYSYMQIDLRSVCKEYDIIWDDKRSLSKCHAIGKLLSTIALELKSE